MIRNLIVIAVASFVLAVACFAGVAALGGRDLAEHGWTIPARLVDESDNDFHISIGKRRDSGPATTRDLAWSGGPELKIDLPADVSYTQGPVAGITVSGPKSLVDQVVLVDGALRFKSPDGPDSQGLRAHFNSDRLTITVVAPAVRAFTLNGSPELDITGYDQPDLTVEINGSGNVTAAGKAEVMTLAIAGSGDADLDALNVRDASVRIAGSGDASLSAKGAVRVSIAGSGDVTLRVKPASLTSNIEGSGDLHLPD